DLSIRGNGNFVIDRDVVVVDVVDPYGATALVHGRIIFNLFHVALAAVAEPAAPLVANMDVAYDGDSARRARSDGHVAGVRVRFQDDRAGNVEAAFEASLFRGDSC